LFIKYAERERERERERDNNGPKGMGMEGQFRKLTNKIMQTSTRKNSNKKKKIKRQGTNKFARQAKGK